MSQPRLMPRKLGVQYPGAIYHVMSRGDHLEALFRDQRDPELFFATLSQSAAKTDWQVHAFCLMSNHFHLVIELPTLATASEPRSHELRECANVRN